MLPEFGKIIESFEFDMKLKFEGDKFQGVCGYQPGTIEICHVKVSVMDRTMWMNWLGVTCRNYPQKWFKGSQQPNGTGTETEVV